MTGVQTCSLPICQEALDYKQYLEKLLALTTKIGRKESDTVYPEWAHSGAQKALVDFGWTNAETPLEIDAVVMESKPHDWVGNRLKERVVASAMRSALPEDFDRFDELFDLVRARDEYR